MGMSPQHCSTCCLLFQDGSGTELRIETLISRLQYLVYEYVCRSLFKADRLMFAMHMVHGMKPDLFEENVSGIKQQSVTWVYVPQIGCHFLQISVLLSMSCVLYISRMFGIFWALHPWISGLSLKYWLIHLDEYYLATKFMRPIVQSEYHLSFSIYKHVYKLWCTERIWQNGGRISYIFFIWKVCIFYNVVILSILTSLMIIFRDKST